MIIPHRVELLYPVWPITNFVITGLCGVAFVGSLAGFDRFLEGIVLESWNPLELLFSSLLHAGLLHLLLNMVFLWVFGNAICAKFGNIKYLGIFFGGALFLAAIHLLFDGRPAVGASGAIYTVLGIFVALYPVNRIHSFYWFISIWGSTGIKAYWLIGFWFATDVYGVVSGSESGVAFWAHIGGFVFGIVFGLLALKNDWLEMSHHDNETLLDILAQRKV
ncbi:MAG: rhomboid family intramembrane serine protease [Verrucomicrobiota bacterium]